MSIQFACGHCGHPIDVEERFAGLRGHCKHCGHATEVPQHPEEGVSTPGLRLKPVEGDAERDWDDERASAEAAGRPRVRPVESHEPRLPSDLRADDLDGEPVPEPGAARWWGRWGKRVAQEYTVLDPDRRDGRGGPTPLSPHYDSRLARFVGKILRLLRDWLYVISIGCLAVAGVGFVLKVRPLLHLGATGVIAANAGMLAVGLFYLVTVPFRDGLPNGLATLLFPPYAVYYWVRHWPRMRRPVVNTLRSFVPILVVGLAYGFYLEEPVIVPAVEREVREVEDAIKKEKRALEGLAGPAPGAAPAPGGDPPPAAQAPPAAADPPASEKAGPPPF